MRLGTQVILPDGRTGTVVFSGLSGFGIKWGLHNPDPSDFEGTYGDCFDPSRDDMDEWPWKPDAYLGDQFPRAGLECVGDDYEITRVGLGVLSDG